ncbi:hypothetical protein [Nocardioides sp.]|uniref:hypothetical protein n=1 Tax=Nocardioides sp. TaxID=35761 RepID=UPI002B8B95CB|nr:hypothetical protein [Nocardioides sp.]HXH79524.1 hypothetical protein [Nocardioides sp.]
MSDATKTTATTTTTTKATDAASGQPITVQIVQPDRAAEGAQNQLDGIAFLEAQEKPGVYVVNDQKVDGNGEPVKKSDG